MQNVIYCNRCAVHMDHQLIFENSKAAHIYVYSFGIHIHERNTIVFFFLFLPHQYLNALHLATCFIQNNSQLLTSTISEQSIRTVCIQHKCEESAATL